MPNAGDSFISPTEGEPSLPEPHTNNLWYQDRGTDAALIFVHGIFSDSRSCWLSEGPPLVYWPDLVSRDRRFDRYSLYLGGYYTALDAGAFKVQHCADQLFRALARPERPDAQSVVERGTLIFVCHSTGGIVVRYLLETRAAEFKEKTVGLVLIASPSFGSAWATKLTWLSEFYNAQLARQLEWGNNSLDDLDERFHRLINERRIPHLLGVEAYENHFVFHRKFLPDHLVVVDKNSAGRYFAPAHLLAQTDHFTSVKPDSGHHPAHELLVDFCSRLERYQRQHADELIARERTDTPPKHGESVLSDVVYTNEPSASIPVSGTNVSSPIEEIAFPACLEALGVPADRRAPITEWIESEVQGQATGEGRSSSYRRVDDLLKSLGEEQPVSRRVQSFTDLVLGCFVPSRLLKTSFYVSAQKVTQTYRSYRNLISQMSQRGDDASDDSVEDKFLLIHRYFRNTGQLLFGPQEALLKRGFPTGADCLLFFVGQFQLDLDDDIARVFPDFKPTGEGNRRHADAAVATVFGNPDPAIYPLVRFKGTVLGRQVSAVLSRKYFEINSLTHFELARAICSSTVVIVGFATAKTTGDDSVMLQPMVCDFDNRGSLMEGSS